MSKLSLIRKYLLEAFKGKNNSLLITLGILLLGVFFYASYVFAAPSLTITVEPLPVSNVVPVVIASSTAEAGKTIDSAHFEILHPGGSTTISSGQCTAQNGTSFFEDHVEFKCEPASISSGEYIMRITVKDNEQIEDSKDTNSFIVDRGNPEVNYDPLPNAPNPIDYSEPIFEGTATDTLTKIKNVRYAWLLASSSAPTTEPGTWTDCPGTYDDYTVNFICNPTTTFDDSVKGDQYRMYVQAIDEADNVSSYTNTYNFTVDTINPTDLEVIYPNGGETLNGGKTYNITWNRPNDNYELDSNPITIEYSRLGDFSDTQVLVENHLPSGPFEWNIPNNYTTNDLFTAKIRITAVDLAGNTIVDESDSGFKINPYNPPYLTIDAIPNTKLSSNVTVEATVYNIDSGETIVSAVGSVRSPGASTYTEFNSTCSITGNRINCGHYTPSSQGSYSIRVDIEDNIGDSGYDTETFIYDYTSPYVDFDNLGTINTPIIPTLNDLYDRPTTVTNVGVDESSYLWTYSSGPGSIIFSDNSSWNSTISANTASETEYVANFKVCDNLNSCSNNTVTFTWTDDPIPGNFNIIEPSGDEILSGHTTYGEDFEIQWTSPGGAALGNFNIEYYNGDAWIPIGEISNNGQFNQSYVWDVPNDDTNIASVRVIAQGVDLTATSSQFIIDSTPPEVEAGSIVGTINSLTSPGASVTDNLDPGIGTNYTWTAISPSPGDVIFEGSTVASTTVGGTTNGDYTAELTVTDWAGNSSSDTVTFSWTYPPDFEVIQPNGGEVYADSQVIDIIWSDSPSITRYDIHYSTDNWVTSVPVVLNTYGVVHTQGRRYTWTIPEEDSNTVQIRISGTNTYGDYLADTSDDYFTIDSTPPNVDAGLFYQVVLGPTAPNASADDGLVGSGIATYQWEQINRDPEDAVLIFSGDGPTSLNPTMYSAEPGVYEARLTVTDNVGHSSFDDVALITNTNPPTVNITAPGKDVHWKGSQESATSTKNIQWNLNTNPGNLTGFDVSYSMDNGLNWIEIVNDISSTTTFLPWIVPDYSSETALMRVITKNDIGETATATQEFIIDAVDPTINIGSIGTTTIATKTGTTATDDIDSPEELTYSWAMIDGPAGGQIVFSPTNKMLDPYVMGTVSGEYIIQLIAQDQAGNFSQASIGNTDNEFYWQGDPEIPIVVNPTSSDIVAGGDDLEIVWYMNPPDPGDLDTFKVEYSLNGQESEGSDWILIQEGLASTTHTLDWVVPEGLNSTSSVIRVTIYDTDGNASSGISANFTIDSTAPVVDTGIMPSPISTPTSSDGAIAIDNFDAEEYLTYNWTMLSEPYPLAHLTITNPASTTATFAGDMSGWYEAMLSSTDRAGNIGTSSLSFYWMSEFDPYITYPTEGVHLPGGETSTATWELLNSGDLSHIEAHYSVNNGSTWNLVSSNIASTSLYVDWQVPDDTNSTTSLFRIYTVDNLGRHATATSQLFIIDSEDPYVDAGSYSDYVNNATAPGATSTDNLTPFEELSFSWAKVSGPGDINFSDSSALNPTISASRNGDYVARLTVTDLAGNSASDTVSFTRKINSGPGGPTITWCSSVEYGDWGDCINGIQEREIIGYDPAFCTPTSAQLDAEQRTCEDLITCTSVTYSDWGSCINGRQTRTVLNRYPSNCVLSEAQDDLLSQSCDSGEEEDDPNQVMEDARANVGEIDEALVKRLMGQILIQVEDLGRAWFVNVDDGARYYLGKPRNAFTVMSMMGKGIKNDLLKKLPIGLLDPKLSNDNDSDGDGLTDRLEEGLETDFFSSDTDGDGYSDYEEVMNGYDPLDARATKSIIDNNLLKANLGQIFIQVETNGEAWYVEPRSEKRYYLGRPLEAFNIMRQFGIGITNEDINKIPVGEFSPEQNQKITDMLEQRKRELEEAARNNQ